MGDQLAARRRPRSVRTLAISQLLPTTILIWLPTWPDMATDGSLCDCSAVSAGGVEADLRARAGDFDDLADAPRAGRSRQALARGDVVLGEVADFVEEFAQVRLVVHASLRSQLLSEPG